MASQKSAAKGKSAAADKKPAPKNSKNTAAPIRREVGAFVCAFLGLFLFIGFFGVDAWFITFFCGLLKGLFGYGYFLFPFAFIYAAYILGFHKGRPVRLRLVSALLLPLLFGALAHLIACRLEFEFDAALLKTLYTTGWDLKSAGAVSGIIALAFEALFSVYGAVPLFFFAFLFLLMISANLSFANIYGFFKNREVRAYPESEEPESLSGTAAARAVGQGGKRKGGRAIDIPLDEQEEKPVEEYKEERVGFFNIKPRVRTPDQIISGGAKEELEEPEEWEGSQAEVKTFPAGTANTPAREEPPKPLAEKVGATIFDEILDDDSAVPRKIKSSEVREETKNIERSIAGKTAEESAEYEYPPVALLKKGDGVAVDGREEISLNRERLDSTLKSFGVSAAITGVIRGPTVTRYDLELDSGVKLNKLTNLAGDLALSLGVSGVRIAPIPDKISTVGIEVPNKLVSTVFLRDIIESPEFTNAASKLSFALGKDIGGHAIVGNISKLPHMLIAGTTGSGKSVCMNSLILSILFKSKPSEVRLIMIDPKMVELGVYNAIPHLYVPVVTDPKKAAGALQWSVVEMMKRYRLFSEVGVRDLAGYNAYMSRSGEPTLPQVVIVIDELADLMLVASKEVEESICRVAQMGRASGMHLVIATQRPSADVITGLMKANIPSRIAFAVSSAMESRIILDTQGAEKLVGAGDMLYSPLGSGKPIRIQGAYVSDDEREEVIKFIKSANDPEYSSEILEQIENAAEGKTAVSSTDRSDESGDESIYDELLPQAVEVIFDTKQASVSMLQRRLKLGYSRAARIVDQMEEIGVVGQFEGSKPRQILMTREEWLARQNGGAENEQQQFEDMDDIEEDGEFEIDSDSDDY